MRVLLIVHGYPPRAWGGTELYTRGLALALRDAGDEVFVLAREADPSAPERRLRRETLDGVEVHWLNNTFREARAFADAYVDDRVRRVVAGVLDAVRPDIVHAQHLTCLGADLLEECVARGLPTVLTLNDYWMICHRGQLLDLDLARCSGPVPDGCARCLDATARLSGVGRALRPLTRMPGGAAVARRLSAAAGGALAGEDVSRKATRERARRMRELLQLPDRLLAPSRTLAERFLAFGAPAGRLRLQQQGIDVERLRVPRAAAPGSPLRIGFLGSMMVSKAPHLLIEAFARLEAGRATLELFGSPVDYHGDTRYPERLRPLLALPGVFHRGARPHAEVGAVLAGLDVVVVPSVWLENAPFVIREAFAAGVPVVASRLGGMAEMVEDDRNGLLFEAGDAGDLERCLRRLLDEPALLPRLRAGIGAPRTLAEDVQWTRSLYAEVVAERAPAQSRPAPRLAAVVLNFRTPDETLLAVRSLLASRRRVDEIVVVENGSGDDSAVRLEVALAGEPRVTLLRSEENLGFAGGVNLGTRHALAGGAELVFLLNSDAVIAPDALAIVEVALATTPTAGIAGPCILSRSFPDRVASAGIRWGRQTGRMRHLRFGETLDPNEVLPAIARVAAVAGCAMLVRRGVFERLGGFAEDYFFSFEEIDFCLRAADAGFSSVLAAAARTYHEGGVSIAERSADRLYYAVRNHLLLARRAPGASALRSACVLLLNVAHTARSAGASPRVALTALWQGVADHRRRRYGPRRAPVSGATSSPSAPSTASP